MKKIYKILLGIALVFFILLISIPLLFQDKIIDLVKTTVNNNVNAQVDFSDANLSFIRNFPSASVQLSDVTVINEAPFKGDTLVFAKDILLKLKLTDLLKSSSGQLSIQSFTIDDALVNVLIDEKGNANYDIAIPSEKTTKTVDETPSNFGLSINSYAITNTTIKYNDKQGKIAVELANLNHSGSGDFSQSNTELDTHTTTDISFAMDENSYAKNQKIQLDAVLGMDLVNNKFSFLKNELKLNQLPLIFDGYVQLNDTNQEIDINFKTPSSDFKNFLGLIPQAYTKSIANVTTKGNFSIKGKVNGILDATHIPILDIVVQSENASFKYPDLPKTVRNININAQVKNTTGKLENTFASINNLSFKIDEDTFSGKATAHNITTNPKLDATIKGTLNLAKINQAYPVNLEQKLSGILKANLRTQFDMNAIKNSAVNRIKNNGTIQINDFVFSSDDLINAFHIKEAAVDFKPSVITLTKFNATTGKSDLKANGTLKNLLGFLLSDKKLQGKLNVNSTNLHIGDFMQETSETTEKKKEETTPKDDTNGTSLKIPAFLDCTLLANAKTVHYDNLALKNVKGTLFIKNQKAILQNVTVGIFNGQVALNGEVNTQNEKPTFDMKLGIKSFDIAESFSSLELLQSLGPIVGAMNGKLNSDINLSGALNTDFTPNLTSLTGKAFAELLTTKINPKKTKSLSLLTDKLSFINLNDLDLSDIKTHLSFDKGKVVVKPFKLKYKDIGINVGGSHGFDQNMNYNLTLDVPAKYLGKDVQGLLSKLSTDEQNVTVPVTANITGNMSNPSVKTDLSSSVTKLSQTLIKQQKDKLVSNTLSKFLPGKKKDTSKTTNKKEDNVKKVTNALKGLFGKKKKGN